MINLAGGGATLGDGGAATANTQLTYRVAHGVMMLAAFVLLMPAAALIARHKWLFGDKEVRRALRVVAGRAEVLGKSEVLSSSQPGTRCGTHFAVCQLTG